MTDTAKAIIDALRELSLDDGNALYYCYNLDPDCSAPLDVAVSKWRTAGMPPLDGGEKNPPADPMHGRPLDAVERLRLEELRAEEGDGLRGALGVTKARELSALERRAVLPTRCPLTEDERARLNHLTEEQRKNELHNHAMAVPKLRELIALRDRAGLS